MATKTVTKGCCPIAVLSVALVKCIESARAQGWQGTVYEYTEADCDFCADAVLRDFGRLPTRKEWHAVLGDRGFVGSRHCSG